MTPPYLTQLVLLETTARYPYPTPVCRTLNYSALLPPHPTSPQYTLNYKALPQPSLVYSIKTIERYLHHHILVYFKLQSPQPTPILTYQTPVDYILSDYRSLPHLTSSHPKSSTPVQSTLTYKALHNLSLVLDQFNLQSATSPYSTNPCLSTLNYKVLPKPSVL